jgi:Leucine-rich repeat (LRR) protein
LRPPETPREPYVSDEGLKALVHLKSLYLSISSITDEGLSGLASLESLEIYFASHVGINSLDSCLTDQGISRLTRLTFLLLDAPGRYSKTSYGLITSHGISQLTNLTHLNLGYILNKSIGDAAIMRLTNLSSLTFTAGCKSITSDGIKALTNLTNLDLSLNNRTTSEGIMYLTKLVKLDLRYATAVTDVGIVGLINLTMLNIAKNNSISDRGIMGLTNLTWLDLSETNSTTPCGISGLFNLTFLDRSLHPFISCDDLIGLPAIVPLNDAQTRREFVRKLKVMRALNLLK